MKLILLGLLIQLLNIQSIRIKSEELNKNMTFNFNSNVRSYNQKIITNELNFERTYNKYKTVEIKGIKETHQNKRIKSNKKRAVPREKEQECVVSKRELNDLKTVVDTAIANLASSNINCNFKTTKKNNCNELINLIQCGISNIQNEYNTMTKDRLSSNEEVQKLLNAYEMLNDKYLKLKDEVKALSGQKYKQNLNKLTTNMQNIEKQLRESNDIVLRKTIELCAFQIHTGNIKNSFKEYNNIMRNNKIDSIAKIIENVYIHITNKNKDNNIDNLLEFIENSPEKCEQFATYLSLITKMQIENHINCYLRNYWSKLNNLSNKMNDQHLPGKITECPLQYIENFRTQLHKIINHINRNCVPSAENAIQFIDELLTEDQKVSAYPVLFEEMKKRNGLNGYEIVLLGFRIQEIIMTQKSENLTGIMNIKEELPSGVNVLISAGAVRLKSKALSNSNFALYNMKTSACTHSVDQYQDWIVRVHQRGRYFQFINVANAHSLRTDLMKTFVTTGFCDRHLWEIIPISNGTSVFIRNKYYGNILSVNLHSKIGTSNSNYNCYQVRVYNQYTGDGFQQWEFKHKIG